MDNRFTTNNSDSTSRWLVSKASDFKWDYIMASLLTLVSAACFVAFSWYLSKFASLWLAKNEILPNLLIYAIAFLAGRYIFAHIASLKNYEAGNKIVSRLKKRLYPKLLKHNQTDSVSSTLLVTRVSDDLKPFFSFFIPYTIASILVVVLLLALSFWIEIWVGIILLVSIIVIPFLMRIIGVGATSLHKRHIDLFMKYSAVFYNRLQTIAEIVSLDNLKAQTRFLADKSKALNKATTNVMKIAILSSAVLELFVSIAIAGVAIYFGLRLLGIMPGSTFGKTYDFHIALFLLILAPYYFFYVRKFVSAYHDKNKALASAKLLMPLLEKEKEEAFRDADTKIESLKISNLSFAYPNTMVSVLHNVHFNFPEKGIVLVKGISGSGKSTLLKILSGNLIIEDGKVSVNGKSNNWSSHWLMANTSYMNQFPFLFDGTIRYNVFLDKKADKDQDYPDFMNKILTKKDTNWDTILTHNGTQLSGGEKQLITLARMILYPKPIAILDEPTASLDFETAEIIIEEIRKLSKNKLVVIASHEQRFEKYAKEVIHLNWGEQTNHA